MNQLKNHEVIGQSKDKILIRMITNIFTIILNLVKNQMLKFLLKNY